MAERLNLTRDQLAAFLKDHQSIKQFERLFARADATPSEMDSVGIVAANAEAAANQAIALLARVSELLELLALAPRDEPLHVDDVTPPNRDDELFEMIKSLSETVPPELITQVETPGASGFSVSITSPSNDNVWLLLQPAAGYAAGTIVLPAVANVIDQQEVSVSCTEQVTALTVDGNGATVQGEPAALAADSTFKLRYNLASTTWHRAE